MSKLDRSQFMFSAIKPPDESGSGGKAGAA